MSDYEDDYRIGLVRISCKAFYNPIIMTGGSLSKS